MAYVVQRRDGRFEIRESLHTPNGPRARTLATFHQLTDEVLDHAESRATRRFDRQHVVALAQTRGASYTSQDTNVLAAQLLRAIGRGAAAPGQAMIQALQLTLGMPAGKVPDSLPPLLDWLGASATDRGDALRDLLRMTDRLPAPRTRRRQTFPRIRSAPG